MAGDFNVVPSDFDIYSTRSYLDNALLQPAPLEAYARLLEQGWTDALRHLHPTEPMFTFWDYRRNRWPRDAGLRIDHILLSKKLKTKRHGRQGGPGREGHRGVERPRAGLGRAEMRERLTLWVPLA